MTMVRGMYAQLMAPGLRKIFNQWLDTYQRDLEYPAVFNVSTTDKPFVDDLELAGTGPMPLKPENTPVSYTNVIQGGTLRYIPLMYALAARMSHELVKDDQYGVMNQVPKALARSQRFTEEMVPWNIFNLGFSTIKTIDGLSLFHNQHPLLGGPNVTNYSPGLGSIISAAGTYPNRPATDVDISFAAIQLMTNQFERLVDSVGLPIALKPELIIAAPAQRFLLRELLGSPGKPGTATNEINSLLGEDLGYAIAHYLTADNPWFAVVKKEYHQLNFFWREKPDTDMDDDFDTGALKQKATMRFTAGASHWMGTWGSNGP